MGSEPTPQAFLEALWAVTSELWRVLKPSGSVFVNLGDKRSGSGGHNNNGLTRSLPGVAKGYADGSAHKRAGEQVVATRRNAPDRYNQAAFGRPKSKMLLPHRFAIGCEDGLADPEGRGWVVRQDIVWSKLNGLPESVTDRCRDSHEYVFHLTKSERYFSAVDEVRTPHASVDNGGGLTNGKTRDHRIDNFARPVGPNAGQYHALGALPGSVWPMPSEPLTLPDVVKAHYDLPDHFAAFPQELPRRLILGWSPSGICARCGEGRRPVVAKAAWWQAYRDEHGMGDFTTRGGAEGAYRAQNGVAIPEGPKHEITGYACACPTPDAPTRSAVVLDPFGGTGTVAGVARELGRFAVGVDLSWDYCRLARYFLTEGRRRFAKTASRTDRERQGVLL